MTDVAINPTGDPKRTPKRVKVHVYAPVLGPKDDLRIGAISRHPDFGFVYISGGTLMSNGRVSNHWDFHKVNMETGELGPRKSGYGWK